jgi:Zn-dependent metalloprotease
MNDYVLTIRDNGGVHINSGIPNHAFYLAAVEIGGYAWEKAGRIWYETLLDPQLRPNANFQRFAGLTLVHADKLFGAGSLERKAVSQAWNAVGIAVS